MLVIELDVVNRYQSTVRVIHYDDDGSSTTIKEEVLPLTSVEVAVYKGFTYSPNLAIRRARSRLYEDKYDVLTRNCESFVNWAITGLEFTFQGCLATIVMILFIIVLVFCFFIRPNYTVTNTPNACTSFLLQT